MGEAQPIVAHLCPETGAEISTLPLWKGPRRPRVRQTPRMGIFRTHPRCSKPMAPKPPAILVDPKTQPLVAIAKGALGADGPKFQEARPIQVRASLVSGPREEAALHRAPPR